MTYTKYDKITREILYKEKQYIDANYDDKIGRELFDYCCLNIRNLHNDIKKEIYDDDNYNDALLAYATAFRIARFFLQLEMTQDAARVDEILKGGKN